MYNEFRIEMIRELVGAGIDDNLLQQVMGVVDKVGSEFDVSRKEKALVPIGMTGPRLVMEYLACRSLEGLSRETLYGYQKILYNFVISLRKPIGDVEAVDLRTYLYQQHRGVSNRTLDRIRGAISVFFRWASAEGRIAKDPCISIHSIKYACKPRMALSQLELEYVRKVCGDIREKAIVEFLYSTGCRVSELCGVKKSDIDWQNMTVQVFGKGSKYRTCFINAKAYVMLQDYLATREDKDEHLFVSDRKPHQGLSRFAVEKIISDVSDRAYRLTGKRVTPHIFRHTTATVALQAGMPVQNVSRMLGHVRVETTMTYAEINNEDVKREHTKYVI